MASLVNSMPRDNQFTQSAIKSVGNDAGESPERRASPRYQTVYRLAKLTRGNRVSLCHLRNISDEGMMLTTNETAPVGEEVLIELSNGQSHNGRVVWSEHGHCGIALDRPVDCAGVLRDLAEEQRSTAYRPMRVDASLHGVAYSETGLHPIRTTNLSQTGMGVVHDGRFHPGLRVLVVLENGLERRGVVRWSQEQQAGILLVAPLTCADLNNCLS
jgi:PilZ domain